MRNHCCLIRRVVSLLLTEGKPVADPKQFLLLVTASYSNMSEAEHVSPTKRSCTAEETYLKPSPLGMRWLFIGLESSEHSLCLVPSSRLTFMGHIQLRTAHGPVLYKARACVDC